MLRLGDLLERPAIVREQNERYSTFKVTPIGGPKELAEWRKKQAVKLATYHAEREHLKDRKKEFIAGPDAPLGELTWEGKVLLADSKKWEEKLLEAKVRRRMMRTVNVSTVKEELPEEKPPLTRWQKFKSWINKVTA